MSDKKQSLTVEDHQQVSDEVQSRIRSFLAGHTDATLAHDPSWMVILRDGLNHQPHYLEARRNGETVGVLPLAYVASMLFGRYLVSLPYLNYGGPLADDDEIRTRLIDRAVELADALDVSYLELRNRQEIEHPKLTEKRTDKVLMWRDLSGSTDELWKSFKPEVRNQVRKGEKHSLEIAWGAHELLPEFYDVFAENMRDLGTPVFGKRLFASILDSMPGSAELCVVRMEQQAVATAILLHGTGQTEVPSASSLRRFNKTCANMWMYHQLLLRAVERGQRVFDFGRSSEDSGTYRFKKQWKAQPQPSVWQYYVRRGGISDVRPDNPKYRRKIETWQKLPIWLTRLIGPSIIRGIP